MGHDEPAVHKWYTAKRIACVLPKSISCILPKSMQIKLIKWNKWFELRNRINGCLLFIIQFMNYIVQCKWFWWKGRTKHTIRTQTMCWFLKCSKSVLFEQWMTLKIHKKQHENSGNNNDITKTRPTRYISTDTGNLETVRADHN